MHNKLEFARKPLSLPNRRNKALPHYSYAPRSEEPGETILASGAGFTTLF